MAYNIDGKIGVDVTQKTLGVDVTAGTDVPRWPVGTHTRQSDGTEWVYLKASATIPQYAVVVSVDGSTTQGTTSTLALRGMSHAIAQQSFVTGDYGWYLISNPLGNTTWKVRVAASCAIDAKLATTAFAGTLDDTTAGTVLRIDGIVLTDSQAAGSSGAHTFRTSQPALSWGAV